MRRFLPRKMPFGEPLKITIFGLTLSSSWGNGHATPYRAILRALHRRGARITFYEKDVPYYASHRDLVECDYCDLRLYADWDEIRAEALHQAGESDIVLTASYAPEGARISADALDLARPIHVFYDLDTPVTLSRLQLAAHWIICGASKFRHSIFTCPLQVASCCDLWSSDMERAWHDRSMDASIPMFTGACRRRPSSTAP